MGYRREKKYQADGGPSVKKVAMLFSTLALPDRKLVRSAFFDALAYNVLVGGTDAHAKNYSVLLRGPRVALAPLYDVTSSAPYLKQGESLRSSIKVGKNWQVRDVTAQDWTQAGAALGLDPNEALERVERFRQGLPDALADAAATAPGLFLKDAQRVAEAVARQGHLVSGADPAARAVNR